MKRSIHVRFFISLLLLLSLMSPVAAVALVDGKKYFKQGMKHEVSEEWDLAVEQFALAVADNPKNSEYRLHLVRSLFNASQMYMKKGSAAAKEKDYEGGYIAFRKAYAFDPTNELAKSEMDRMVRLQKGVNGDDAGNGTDENGKVRLIPTGYVQPAGAPQQVPQKLEKLRDIPFPSGVDLQFIIKELARDLDINVLFDTESFRTPNRKTFIDLKNVTAARALDYIFLQEGLFFQKVGPRTILVAMQTQRQKFQQLVLRTFYLSNAAPKDIAKVVQTAIPAQPGRSGTIVLTDDATNSVTIRDTEENIRLIGKLISSLDKDRAEVVMEVAIYEVSKSDLLRIGNQIGGLDASNTNQLTNLGGIQPGTASVNGNFISTLATSIATGVLIPSSSISAFQSKGTTKLIASTQIHAFNNEDSSARIGQRVPVQSAQFVTGNQPNQGGNGIVSNVINYEQVGLTLKFKPIVFPNQDVQVAMEIESKDVAVTSNPLIPGFTERTIKGTARIQNNKTLLLASVAQGSERNSRQGLPFLGGLPFIGRLFSTPTKDNSQVDIVIAVTPRVIRAPAILPEDEVERPTGSLGVPTSGLLEAMIIEEERQELLAATRRTQNTAVVKQVESPAYVPTEATATGRQNSPVSTETASAKVIEASAVSLKPIDSSVKTLQLNQTSDIAKSAETEVKPSETVEIKETSTESGAAPTSAPAVEIRFGGELPEMKTGEKLKIPVIISGSGTFRSAVIGLKFDDKKMAVRTVSFGDVFGTSALNSAATPFLNQNGKMYVSLIAKDGQATSAAGTLAFIEIEMLVAGRPEIAFDRDVMNFLTADGKNFVVKF